MGFWSKLGNGFKTIVTSKVFWIGAAVAGIAIAGPLVLTALAAKSATAIAAKAAVGTTIASIKAWGCTVAAVEAGTVVTTAMVTIGTGVKVASITAGIIGVSTIGIGAKISLNDDGLNNNNYNYDSRSNNYNYESAGAQSSTSRAQEPQEENSTDDESQSTNQPAGAQSSTSRAQKPQEENSTDDESQSTNQNETSNQLEYFNLIKEAINAENYIAGFEADGKSIEQEIEQENDTILVFNNPLIINNTTDKIFGIISSEGKYYYLIMKNNNIEDLEYIEASDLHISNIELLFKKNKERIEKFKKEIIDIVKKESENITELYNKNLENIDEKIENKEKEKNELPRDLNMSNIACKQAIDNIERNIKKLFGLKENIIQHNTGTLKDLNKLKDRINEMKLDRDLKKLKTDITKMSENEKEYYRNFENHVNEIIKEIDIFKEQYLQGIKEVVNSDSETYSDDNQSKDKQLAKQNILKKINEKINIIEKKVAKYAPGNILEDFVKYEEYKTKLVSLQEKKALLGNDNVSDIDKMYKSVNDIAISNDSNFNKNFSDNRFDTNHNSSSNLLRNQEKIKFDSQEDNQKDSIDKSEDPIDNINPKSYFSVQTSSITSHRLDDAGLSTGSFDDLGTRTNGSEQIKVIGEAMSE